LASRRFWSPARIPPDDMVSDMVNLMLQKQSRFKKLHKALALLTPRKMVEGVSIPLHPAAKKLYEAKGVLY
jgi:TRAP-type uncharacterized transport system substrate-binding protein